MLGPSCESSVDLQLGPNTQIIKMSEVAEFDFHDVVFKPYQGKVF